MKFRSFLAPKLVHLDEGHFGRIYRVDGYMMKARPATLLAYKEYKEDPTGPRGELPDRAGVMVEKAVDFWKKMASEKPDVCAEIGRYFAWPWEIVKDEKVDEPTGRPSLEVCGFLMPLAPADFFWQDGRVSGQVRTLDWLAAADPYCQRMAVDRYMAGVTEADRLLLMTQLAFAFAVLHKQGWVVGDFSYRNAAFRLRPPQIMLFDCDDAASLSDQDRQQPHTEFWKPPECEDPGGQRLQDHETDVYKLGLAIVRYLKPGQGATTTYDPARLVGILGPKGLDLVSRAVSVDRRNRPTARDIFEHLKKITDPMIASPVIKCAELITPVTLRGADGRAHGRVAWQIQRADTIQIKVGEDQPQTVRTVTLTEHPDQCAFTITESAQVTLVATNHYGTRRCVLGDITVFDIPRIAVDFTDMQRPEIPALPEPPFDPAEVAFPGGVPAAPEIPDTRAPDISVPEIPVPDGRLPEFENLLRALAPDGMVTPSPSDVGDAVRDGMQSQVEMIRDESGRFDALLREKLADRPRENREADDGHI